MKRIFDLFFSLIFIISISAITLIIEIIKISSKGPVLYWSDRIEKFKIAMYEVLSILYNWAKGRI